VKKSIFKDVDDLIEGVRLIKSFGKYPLFILTDSNKEILKGFSIVMGPREIDLALWFCPAVTIDNNMDVFWSFNHIFTDTMTLPQNKNYLIKKSATDAEIIETVSKHMIEKMDILDSVNDYITLTRALENNFENWFEGAINQCQYAMLLFHQKQYQKAIDILERNIVRVNQHNPIFRKVSDFLAVSKNDYQMGSDQINSWRAENMEKYEKMGFYNKGK